MCLFDTDTYSNLIRGNRFIGRRFSQVPPGSVYLCAIKPEEMLRVLEAMPEELSVLREKGVETVAM